MLIQITGKEVFDQFVGGKDKVLRIIVKNDSLYPGEKPDNYLRVTIYKEGNRIMQSVVPCDENGDNLNS